MGDKGSFFYDRRQVHADLARWVSRPDSRPEGHLREVDQEVTRSNKIGQSAPWEVNVPFSSLFSERTWQAAQQRNLAASTGSVGGYVVGVTLSGFEIILRNVLVLGRAGAQILSGLSSNVVFPRQQTVNTFSYLAEGATHAITDQAFGAVAATPRRFSGTASFSRQLWTQAPDIQSEQIDSFGRDCLAESERAAFQGTPPIQPLGLFNLTAASPVNIITYSSSATATQLAQTLQKLAQQNVDLIRVSWVCDPNTFNKWCTVPFSTNASKYLINESNFYQGSYTIIGTPCYITQNVPANSVVAGDFSKLTLCFFGSEADPPVRLTIDPFSSKRSEQVEVTADMRQDVVVRREEAFAISSGSTIQ